MSTSMKVFADLPTPAGRQRVSKYGLADLTVGQALVVQVPADRTPTGFARTMAAVKMAAQKRNPEMKFTQRQLPNGHEDIPGPAVGIWRVA